VTAAVSHAEARARDLELVRQAVANERGAQRALFHQLRGGIHHALFRVFGSNRELEDLIQEAFVAIFRALPSFRGESGLARWSQVIAVRTAFAALGKPRPPMIDLELVAHELGDGDDARRRLQLREVTRRLYAALDRLDPTLRIAFALAVIDGRSHAEVAVLTESTVMAVKARIWRARRDLEKRAARDELLAEYLDELEDT
jgi:RNA polymerase sigma-70 factor, ECF subfamily